MMPNTSPQTPAAPLQDEPDIPPAVTCPMCHTVVSLTQSALDANGSWRCTRCGQRWHAARLAAVAGYASWVARRG